MIEEFLDQNPFFDFSSLARTAIQQFVRDPRLEIKGVKARKQDALRNFRNQKVGEV